MSNPTTWLWQYLPDGSEGKVRTNGRAGSDVSDIKSRSRTSEYILPLDLSCTGALGLAGRRRSWPSQRGTFQVRTWGRGWRPRHLGWPEELSPSPIEPIYASHPNQWF